MWDKAVMAACTSPQGVVSADCPCAPCGAKNLVLARIRIEYSSKTLSATLKVCAQQVAGPAIAARDRIGWVPGSSPIRARSGDKDFLIRDLNPPSFWAAIPCPVSSLTSSLHHARSAATSGAACAGIEVHLDGSAAVSQSARHTWTSTQRGRRGSSGARLRPVPSSEWALYRRSADGQ